jgi:hypothetical protein
MQEGSVMEVYLLRWPGEEYPTLGAVDEGDNKLIETLAEGAAWTGAWSPLRLQAYGNKRQKKKGLPDCSFWFSVPIFSERAVQALSDIFLAHGELLPVVCDETPYYAYNILTVVPDAFDEERSEYNRFQSGNVGNIYRYEFRPDKVQGATIFKISQQILLAYATDSYVERVNEAGLTGFNAVRIWVDRERAGHRSGNTGEA